MEMKILAQQLGISHQMANRLKRQGMDCTSLESAKAWRRANIDTFRSKTGRIGRNTGIKHGTKATKDKTVSDVLTHIIPELWFDQIGWLGTALRENGVSVSAEVLVEVQQTLYLIYMTEVDEYLQSENSFKLSPIMQAQAGKEIYPSLITRLNQILSK